VFLIIIELGNYVAEASAVADFLKRRRDFSCTRCGTAMHEVVSIAPLAGEPGLRAYQCRKCQYVTSVLWQPAYKTGIPPTLLPVRK
jgi:late competence protein required for DNA uptake (superfamily II DNA/RNA helicase)